VGRLARPAAPERPDLIEGTSKAGEDGHCGVSPEINVEEGRMFSDLDWQDDRESVNALDSVLVPVPDDHDVAPDDAVIDPPTRRPDPDM
jgi:hypothetical protein